MEKLNREKYLEIAKREGVPAALSALHAEYGEIEFESFEGQKGWQPDLWQSLDEIRTFSRELWGMRIADAFYAGTDIRHSK